MKPEDKEHFKLTSHYTNPIMRYWNGHFITGLQYRDEVMRK